MNKRKPIADRIMTWCWGLKSGCHWDENSLAHRFWKRKIKKYKKSVNWWRKNYYRIWKNEEDI